MIRRLFTTITAVAIIFSALSLGLVGNVHAAAAICYAAGNFAAEDKTVTVYVPVNCDQGYISKLSGPIEDNKCYLVEFSNGNKIGYTGETTCAVMATSSPASIKEYVAMGGDETRIVAYMQKAVNDGIFDANVRTDQSYCYASGNLEKGSKKYTIYIPVACTADFKRLIGVDMKNNECYLIQFNEDKTVAYAGTTGCDVMKTEVPKSEKRFTDAGGSISALTAFVTAGLSGAVYSPDVRLTSSYCFYGMQVAGKTIHRPIACSDSFKALVGAELENNKCYVAELREDKTLVSAGVTDCKAMTDKVEAESKAYTAGGGNLSAVDTIAGAIVDALGLIAKAQNGVTAAKNAKFTGPVSASIDTLPKGTAGKAAVAAALKIVFGAAGAIAVLVIALSGFKYVMSQGDPQQIAKAKNSIMYASIGLVIVVFAGVAVAYLVDGIS